MKKIFLFLSLLPALHTRARQSPVLLQPTPGITLTRIQLQAPGNRHCTLFNLLTHTQPQILITFQFFHQPGDTAATILSTEQANQLQPMPLATFISNWTTELQSGNVFNTAAQFSHEYQLMHFGRPLIYFDGTTYHYYSRIASVAKYFRIIHQPGQDIFQNGLFTLNTAATPIIPAQQSECGSATPIPTYPGLWTDTAINRQVRGNIFFTGQTDSEYHFIRHHFAGCHHCIHLGTESLTFNPGIGIIRFTSRILQRQTLAKIKRGNPPNPIPLTEWRDSDDFYTFQPLTVNGKPYAPAPQ
jgi:hypothetical protein